MPVRGRPFEPGNKIGKGRPTGSRNKVSSEARELLRSHAAVITRKAIAEGLRGDRFLLARTFAAALGLSRDSIKGAKGLPLTTVEELISAHEFAGQMMLAGEITPDQLAAFGAFVERQRKLIETSVIEKRVSGLEESKVAAPKEKAA